MNVEELLAEVEAEVKEAEIARLAWRDALRELRLLLKQKEEANDNAGRQGESESPCMLG